MPTALSFARRIAHSEGFKPIKNADLDYLIWERTGYPGFWPTGDMMKDFEAQLRQAFQDIKTGKAKDWDKEEASATL